jgi:hypothetical protein
MKYKKRPRMTIIHSLNEIPDFATEDEEREWWATHDLSPELYDSLPSETTPSGRVIITLERTKSPRS